MIVFPFLVSELCPLKIIKKFLYVPYLNNHSIYLSETLQECVSDQDDVSHIIVGTFHFSVMTLRSFFHAYFV